MFRLTVQHYGSAAPLVDVILVVKQDILLAIAQIQINQQDHLVVEVVVVDMVTSVEDTLVSHEPQPVINVADQTTTLAIVKPKQ